MFYLDKISHHGSGELVDLSSLPPSTIRDHLINNLRRCFGNVPLGIYLDGSTYTLSTETPVAQASVFFDSDKYYIYNVCTLPEYQRKGLMRTLLQHLLSDLPHNSRVVLRVLPNNIAAISLYQSLGFKLISQEYMELYIGLPYLG